MAKTTAVVPEKYALGGVTVQHERTRVRIPARHVLPEVHAPAVEYRRIVDLVGEAFQERNRLDAEAHAIRDSVGSDYAARLAAGDVSSVDDDARRVSEAETRASVAQNRAEGALRAASAAYGNLARAIQENAGIWRAYLATQAEPAHTRVARASAELADALQEAVELEGIAAMLDRPDFIQRGIVSTELAASSVLVSLAVAAVDEAVSTLSGRRPASVTEESADDFDVEMV